MDHTGFTNDYLVETQTTLACLYNDQSVMESHSCATLMGVLSRKESDLFADFEPADRTRCKKGIIEAILSTDMARHFSVVSNYTLRCEAAQFSKDNPADRQLLINILLVRTVTMTLCHCVIAPWHCPVFASHPPAEYYYYRRPHE